MRIVVASGKGGTGKTTIATSLALVAAEHGSVHFLDCDVEAPNAGLFLHPKVTETKDVGILIPQVDENRCTYCGECAKVCQFHAIVTVGKKVLVFPELCHGCGSCALICPEKAITEQLDVLGVLQGGRASNRIGFTQGTLNVGEPMAVPIIRELKQWELFSSASIEIRDAPPGASCPVVESLRGADFALLVTEPTPFGLHDLKQVVEVTRELRIPSGVIINRDGIGNADVELYCKEIGLPILMRIPMQREIAERIASGKTLLDVSLEYHKSFEQLYENLLREGIL
jgi:MinD superfamily P-loop ATPase